MNNEIIISFDLDDTLFDNGPVIIHAFRALYDYLVKTYPGFDTHFDHKSFIEFAHETRVAHPDIVDFNILRHIHINAALAKAGFDEQNTETAYSIFLEARQQVRLFPDTLAVLTALQEKFPLISISNGNANPDRIGLGGFFKASFNPTSVGYAKPNPSIYSKVCENLSVSPKQIIHIGDCIDNDYHAAIKAGCQAIWFNTKGEKNGPPTQVRYLSELPQVINSIVLNLPLADFPSA